MTPPELAGFRLAGNGAGRIGGVRLELVATNGGTRLGACYQQVPLRIMPPFQSERESAALVYLLNPTAGLLDGDGQLIDLTVGPGAAAVVVGQSATRIHPCLNGFATQQWRVRVAEGATLTLLPGPAIPFAGCRYYQRLDVELAADARFVLGDIWLAGRYARDAISERFQFETIVQELHIRRAGRLVFRDRYCWRGPWNAGVSAWHFGDAPACGSCFYTGTLESGQELLDPKQLHAAFTTAAGDTCLRWCGTPEQVTTAIRRVATQALNATWLADDSLAPCHWFSTLS